MCHRNTSSSKMSDLFSCQVFTFLFIASFQMQLLTALGTSCPSLTTCSLCISTKSCMWCSTSTSAYCLSQDDDTTNCSSLMNPRSTIVNSNTLLLNEENQVSLESIDVRLKVGEPVTFNVSVKAAENFPLDLYMLMDLSGSFNEDLKTVKILAPSLANSLGNFTNDFQIGFGTFTDKPSPPYTSKIQSELGHVVNGKKSSCTDGFTGEPCSLPIDYEHVTTLTNSSEIFSSSVQDLIISISADIPEGTLDAMMQAIVCRDVVGWREKSRKILLVMTDDSVHTAGDGTLAGIYKPNDAKCHTEFDPVLNKTVYTAAIEYDFPSIEQIRLTLREYEVVPVFAVTAKTKSYFENLAEELNAFVTIIAEDSSNLLDVLATAYIETVSRVSLSFDQPIFIQSSVVPTCPEGSTLSNELTECDNVTNGTTIFHVTLTLTECVAELQNGGVYPLEVIAPGFDSFIVNIEGSCNCECDSNTLINMSLCVNGELRCGRCYCDDGWKGDRCDCSTEPCPVGANGQECSGRGTCDGCGGCTCNKPSSPQNGVKNPIIFGSLCECNNYECDTDSNGVVCSGRGNCTCSNGVYSCECEISSLTGERHTGDACQCSSDHCVDPSNPTGEICSGNGICDPCAQQGKACTCDENYIGVYCGSSVSQNQATCSKDDVRRCVICYGEAAEDDTNVESICPDRTCSNFTLLKQSAPDNYDIPGSLSDTTIDCSFISGECLYVYYAAVAHTEERIYAVEPRVCLLIPWWAIAIILLVCVILIGCFILWIIKCCIIFIDYREFKEFEKEVQEADFSNSKNPMYQTPKATYHNVAFGKD